MYFLLDSSNALCFCLFCLSCQKENKKGLGLGFRRTSIFEVSGLGQHFKTYSCVKAEDLDSDTLTLISLMCRSLRGRPTFVRAALAAGAHARGVRVK